MSQAVKVAMLASKDLGKNDRLVLLAVAAHTNGEGNAWPSVATIAEYVGCSTRTVQRCLARLVQLGRLAVSKVKGIVTQVYRLIVGLTDPATGVTEPGGGGDSDGVSPEELEDHKKLKGRAAARNWHLFTPKTKTPAPKAYPYPERRGAALPIARGVGQCPKHQGSLAHNCAPCRSERLGGVA